MIVSCKQTHWQSHWQMARPLYWFCRIRNVDKAPIDASFSTPSSATKALSECRHPGHLRSPRLWCTRVTLETFLVAKIVTSLAFWNLMTWTLKDFCGLFKIFFGHFCFLWQLKEQRRKHFNILYTWDIWFFNDSHLASVSSQIFHFTIDEIWYEEPNSHLKESWYDWCC